MVKKGENKIMKLTGKAFRHSRPFRPEGGQVDPSFQLEAEIEDGSITRLQAKGQVPEECIFDSRHKLEITGVLESLPPLFTVECSCCGFRVNMEDPNYFYELI